MKPLVIALNGPPQVGKGWFADKLTHGLLPFRSRVMSLAEPLREEVLRKFGWENNPDSYGKFKKHVFPDGLTGREHLINHGNRMRAIDINYWSRQLTQNPKFSDAPIIVVDDMGFPDEQTWINDHAERLMTIVIAPSEYSIGCIFMNDSRICLNPRGGYRTTTSNEALRIFIERLKNANPYESTLIEKRPLWFSALMEHAMV